MKNDDWRLNPNIFEALQKIRTTLFRLLGTPLVLSSSSTAFAEMMTRRRCRSSLMAWHNMQPVLYVKAPSSEREHLRFFDFVA